jgi:hypothetical protein
VRTDFKVPLEEEMKRITIYCRRVTLGGKQVWRQLESPDNKFPSGAYIQTGPGFETTLELVKHIELTQDVEVKAIKKISPRRQFRKTVSSEQ